MEYTINVAKRYSIGTGYQGADEYAFFFRIEDTNIWRFREVLAQMKEIYQGPDYQLTVYETKTYREEKIVDEV